MGKMLIIAWKDLKVAFRDRAALVMLLGPFLFTLAMGLVTGSFSRSDAGGLDPVAAVVVNLDDGPLGDALVEALAGEDVRQLLEVSAAADPQQARARVDEDQAAAAVIVPAGFSAGLMPNARSAGAGEVVPIEIYANPGRPISAGVVKTIVARFAARAASDATGVQVAVEQLLRHGLIPTQEAPAVGVEVAAYLARSGGPSPLAVSFEAGDAQAGAFDPLAVLAPSMAMLFLMYTVGSVGGRSILDERETGTLPRMLTTPSTAAQILGGKVFGVYLTGVTQVGVLILASTLLFDLRWGDAGAVVLLVLAAVAGATGWGILLAALARTPGQVSSVGTALMLIFGILGGSFLGGAEFSGFMGALSKITPNAWAQQGFATLARGGALAQVATPILGLLVMAVGLFTLAVLLFQRRGLTAG